ncbi:synaptic vesicle glycoprotein 2B-like [Prorops nasuta]|uniref:synaptic vesicle glycoprotein 2B-like n=1 Tax=Prorops nasuta TaxID=863751 RepID=UPI0034CE8BC7
MAPSIEIQESVELNIQHAVNETGFGKFNIKVAILCGLIYCNTAFSITSIGFVLPSAACDFQMTTIDKDRLSTSFMLGMLAGAYFWGCFADMKGRKYALMVALLSHGGIEFVSSFVSNYWCFIFLKTFSGFALSGQSGLLFTYLGEFQPTKYRDRLLCWLEMAWTIGLILLPLLAWLVIPMNFTMDTWPFYFHSWNIFVLACSIPSLLIGIWICFFPETPKYLAEANMNHILAKVLTRMYAENTGNAPEEYFKTVANHEIPSVSEMVRKIEGREEVRPDEGEKEKKKSLNKMMKVLCSQTTALLRPPYIQRTLSICTLMFCVTSSYYTLILWFPDMFQRFAKFEELHPDSSTSMCKLSSNIGLANETMTSVQDTFGCQDSINMDVFLHTLILGLSCLPASILLPLTVDRVGYRFYLVFCTLSACGITIGLFFVKSATQNLILSCLFEALLSVCMSIVFCVVVDLFPTKLRVMAAALSAFCGRLGSLFGNALFGYLIDTFCVSLIGIVALELLVSAVLGTFLSRSGQDPKAVRTGIIKDAAA